MHPAKQVVLPKMYLLWSAPLAIIGLAALCLVIAALVRTIKRAELVKTPLRARSVVEFSAPGDVLLHEEGPRLTRAFANLRYTLANVEGGPPLAVSRATITMQSSGFDTVRQLEGSVYIPAPGRYELRVDGLNDQKTTRCQIVFTRPYTLMAVLCILGIVFSALAFIGGTVLSLLAAIGGKVS